LRFPSLNFGYGPVGDRLGLVHHVWLTENGAMVLREFILDEQGQDLIEYTLLMAFVALASAPFS
jgi:hypothetical protein